MSNSSSPPATEMSEPQDRDLTSRTRREKRRRVRHQKSRKGCYTCKMRRVKVGDILISIHWNRPSDPSRAVR
ncbi:uncharacterized protein BO80DRAFT_251478 [Aspergillus ibericus CBS 121593]|uniref:Uncharacterized protein n=1 Tax=Aspergillus ibericus CBS 121593 TaxID=1448316 RepID=A0A395GJM9_9EURO|nr:hypothetical protein BO80DRAFT_251478 [Aspergillus ibericus CBS 121593]RAK95691.1 hypothetical protein BO80DRAFT_251478 [Aspergillus ibericus CBS 121593]